MQSHPYPKKSFFHVGECGCEVYSDTFTLTYILYKDLQIERSVWWYLHFVIGNITFRLGSLLPST